MSSQGILESTSLASISTDVLTVPDSPKSVSKCQGLTRIKEKDIETGRFIESTMPPITGNEPRIEGSNGEYEHSITESCGHRHFITNIPREKLSPMPEANSSSKNCISQPSESYQKTPHNYAAGGGETCNWNSLHESSSMDARSPICASQRTGIIETSTTPFVRCSNHETRVIRHVKFTASIASKRSHYLTPE